MSEGQEASRGDGPLVTEAPTVTIAGRTIRMARLRYRDLARLSRILVAGKRAAGIEIAPLLNSGGAVQGEAFVTMLLAGFGHAEQDTIEFLARLLNADVEAIDDPDQFPPGSLLDVAIALAQHPDLVSFLGGREKAAASESSEAKTTSPAPSSELSTG